MNEGGGDRRFVTVTTPWLIAAILLLAAPLAFSTNSAITVINQMAITIVFALSYNMLLGQAGMLSFGHAVYMGVGGFMCLHAMNYAQGEGIWLPLPFLPLIAGMFSLGVATVIGAFSVRRSGAVFAMISLGVVELVAATAITVGVFFQRGGAGGDRTLGAPFLGIDFAQQTEVYYLNVGWLLISVLAMYLFTRTPVGRMANAVRDNPERAEFVGYSANTVRLISFCGAGFFAGVAGGMFAITYEIITAENLGVQASGAILMVTFLGGVGFFFGPIVGAVVFTCLQTLLSLETDLWRLYVGALFLAMVMFFPGGLAGLIDMHRPIIAGRKWTRLVRPYAATIVPSLIGMAGACGLIEMMSHRRKASVGDDVMVLFWTEVDTGALIPWVIALSLFGGGFGLARRYAPDLIATWRDLSPVQR